MFGIGTGELLLLAIIALLVLGPERMPKLMRDVGRTVGDLRRTSDELRGELLSADQAIRREISLEPAAKEAPATPEESKAAAAGATMAATQAEVVTPAELAAPAAEAPVPEPEAAAPEPERPAPEPEETAFDREARLARERLEDPEEHRVREERAAKEGWTVPTDEAGTSPREG